MNLEAAGPEVAVHDTQSHTKRIRDDGQGREHLRGLGVEEMDDSCR